MSEHLEHSGDVFDIYHVRGEAVSLWIPLSFALLGVISSVLVAQLLLFSNLKIGDLLSWPPNISNQYEQETEGPAGGATGLPEGKAEYPTTINGDSESISTEIREIKSIQTSGAADGLKPASSLAPDCPPLFFFTFSKASATPNVQNLMPKIKRLNSWLRQHPGKKVFVEGHTDSYGTEEYNLLLSYRRAKAAEKILIEAGISKDQVITRAMADQEPLQGQPPQSKKNRRATIRVEALQACINSLINGDSN